MDALLPVANVLGRLLSIFSLAYLMPIAAAIFYEDGTTAEFVAAMIISLGGGLMLYGVTRSHYRELKPRDGFLLVSTVWALMAAIATIPLLLVYDTMSFTDAFFETMSGLTTTGSTIMTDLDHAPPAINIWRHELNWLGGMGIIVLAVAVLPLLGVGGMQLYKAETPGPMKDSKLTARIADTAKALWLVYFSITVLCIVLLNQAGLSWLDSICHAFAALGLGGFSTRDASVGAFDNPMVEFVLIVFMVIAAMNFATHFVAMRGRDLRAYWQDVEARGVVGLIVTSCFGVALYVWLEGTYEDYPTALRHVSFNLVSMATDCGFASQDFDKWPIFAPLWMLFLSCITASSGSTGGGIKMIRTLILAKQANRELTRLIHPAVVNPVKVGGSAIPNNVVIAVLGFIFLYFMSVVMLTFVMILSGLDFMTSLGAVVASINNAGPGLNKVGPATNYAVLTDFQTWVCTFTMLLGRLEVLSLAVVFTPQFWRK
ncbi:potassium transporter TrkG [Zoogloea sp.]|mgnify:FL=1|jgi:trk system potassium uptake protein TrkH|uniref:TrkH family potassium uptake protein n=1 Tax=Zoogloea sp. TaxID=49181 RepID=UPI001B5D5E15|nr:potassium transporter TrkG [Zoogloea sp.]MBK6655597.1 TrkH family potassium uptake protein [Zoogloea sp.]MBP7443923.1 TrkH family potassium uptake protein [Zoogloea sp.]HOY00085.1 potassium transporter TrkG [Zoogloea sp.]HPI59255.1 potassium transporter TrkG [Zoogloea sp.]